ncbi:cation diffusion facilitator family transporter [bacterium]|nr:cation diffusion facilitator family transporter [bacterium]
MHKHATHNHQHGHQHDNSLGWVFVLNVAFTIAEFVGSYFTNSIAIFSDALHDAGDSVTILVAVLLERLSTKKANARYTYGYRRYTIVSALLVSLILISGSVIIVYNGVERLQDPQPVHFKGMLLLAIIGVLVNGGAAFKLLKGKKGVNQRAIKLHLLEDTLGWVAVLLGAVVIKFTGFFIIDPILSLGIALFIAYNAGKNIIQILKILLQRTPVSTNQKALRDALKNHEAVAGVHDLHLWTLDGEKHIASVHIRVDKNYDLTELTALKSELKELIAEFGIGHTTIEFDKNDAACDFEDCN